MENMILVFLLAGNLVALPIHVLAGDEISYREWTFPMSVLGLLWAMGALFFALAVGSFLTYLIVPLSAISILAFFVFTMNAPMGNG